MCYNGIVKSELDEGADAEELLRPDATAFRALAARVNFLAQDSPELQFLAKELSRDMTSPTLGSWGRLKKLARFLVGRRRVLWTFVLQDEPSRIQVFADSEWDGDRLSRKSTSGGVICL